MPTRHEREAAAIRAKLRDAEFWREKYRREDRLRQPDGGRLTPHLITEDRRK